MMAKREPVIVKRDLRKNWEKSSYIPKENVIIVMDNPDGSVSLMLGDGATGVNDLPDILQANVQSTRTSIVDEEDTLIL